MSKRSRLKIYWFLGFLGVSVVVNFAMGCPLTFERLNQLITLSGLEVILGFDNLLMVALYVNQLPKELQAKGRALGMLGALITRIGLLCGLSWVMRLVKPLFTIGGHAFSGHDLILIGGGAFLVWKATTELHKEVEGISDANRVKKVADATLRYVVLSIAWVDMLFSIDSVVTAVGMAKDIPIMVLAVVVAMIVMYKFSKIVGDFIDQHSSVKVLALVFLALIGFSLLVEGFGKEIEKGYIYAMMGFATFVNILELRKHSKAAKRGAHTRHEHELAAEQAVEDLAALVQK